MINFKHNTVKIPLEYPPTEFLAHFEREIEVIMSDPSRRGLAPA